MYVYVRETHDLTIQQMQLVLSTKDFELAALQQKFTVLNAEAVELRRSIKREGNCIYMPRIMMIIVCTIVFMYICCWYRRIHGLLEEYCV